MIQSPLNYTGGKFRLLPQILPHFPKETGTFVDLFCGGCNVGINVEAEQVIYNDLNDHLLRLYSVFKRLGRDQVLEWIYEIISAYGLSLTSRDGYPYYGCESSHGVGSYNRPHFLRLRKDFNERQEKDDRYYVMLYVLIVYSFNNQIRFNNRGEFNLPVGKRDFNRKMEEKLSAFIERLQNQDCRFVSSDFRAFNGSSLNKKDFVYADPPYLITCATYNEQGGWGEGEERDLLEFLDRLDMQGISFALSNVLRSKGKENSILLKWLRENQGRYRAIDLDYSYSNSNYHTKDRLSGAEEVLIVNY